MLDLRDAATRRAWGITGGTTSEDVTTTVCPTESGPGASRDPLARLGFTVVEMETTAPLIKELEDELAREAIALPVRVVDGDLLRFRKHIPEPVGRAGS